MTTLPVPSLLDVERSEFDALFGAIETALAGSAPSTDPSAMPASAAPSVDIDTEGDRTRRPLPVLEALAHLRRAGILPAELRVAWVGAAGPELHSWLEAAARLDFQLTLAVPDGFEPDAALFLACEGEAPERIVRVREAARATRDADLVVGPGAPAFTVTGDVAAAVRSAVVAWLVDRHRPRVDFRALADLAPPDLESPDGVGLRAQMR